MNSPKIKQPTKKTFHFPKSAEKLSEAPAEEAVKDAPASNEVKAAKAEKVAKTEKVTKTVKAKKPAVKKSAARKAAPAAPDTKKAAKPQKAAAAPAAETDKVRKPKKDKEKEKEKVVRDSFTMPRSDYAKLDDLKQRCLEAGVAVKKSELLRAGLSLLMSAPAKRLLAAVSELDTVKTGRPSKS
jgi:hypothetical protein